ncbi:molybdenum cofactor sulfurase [Grosmannia clavigera kw1407]|uniref:Molybdenum cofactor sulfurase n=1 Tax=Grosmannia clavigera (strain kw1407 / UAMH 11150) TaxID=655863 RepID=F0XKN7_GROCL|nr:molybdenum cofactor sulfurase [Grosmannia clavigera kw1407]EFX01756.1 molybdenum cofactor sulfurase [Grosmannia clavigera kw1407]
MAGFDGWPRPAYNASVEGFREREYPMLKDNVYLDHAGTTLYSRSLVERATADMMSSLLGNPHAASPSSQAASLLVEDVRLRALQFLGADPAAFDLIFVANATAGIKLVTEAFRTLPGGGFASGVDNVLFAYPAQSNMDGQRYPLSWASDVRTSPNSNDNADSHDATSPSPRIWTLLDAAAYASTAPLDLHDAVTAPDFVVLSFYKIFGWPDLGALLVRRPAEAVFDTRRYFGGGTVDVVVCTTEQWHARRQASLHERLEDGTLPIHSIAALGAALDTHATMFGSMKRVASHTTFLADRLRQGLLSLHHSNGVALCEIYGNERASGRGGGNGPVVAFNLRNVHGAWVSLTEFDKLAALRRFHVRTGGVCNPGGISSALNLAPWELRRNFANGMRCGDTAEEDIVSGKPTGIIRVSLGAMSTLADVDQFLAFLHEFYCDAGLTKYPTLYPATRLSSSSPPSLVVASISVYPIKSCGAFAVATGTPWEVRPEGLAWDREWCLVHRGTGRALSQKQHPQMALLRPQLDFVRGVLRVVWGGARMEGRSSEICVPLSSNPAMFAPTSSRPISLTASSRWPSRASRVCGEEIAAQVYTTASINDFFSDVLGVPCSLARFPPGGHGKSMRHAKAHLQKHQAGHNHAPPSPPESDSDGYAISGRGKMPTSSDSINSKDAHAAAIRSQTARRRILLSNESPILAINMASVRALNSDIRARNSRSDEHSSTDVPPDVFRANIVLDNAGQTNIASGHTAAYAEDNWSHLRIGSQSFRMLGACRRCHMVCVNQQTAARGEEPFVTLSQTRRFDGKVFFGIHMAHEAEDYKTSSTTTLEQQWPTIMVGDAVQVQSP